MIIRYKEYNNIEEDKVYKFSEYEPTKYNGNLIVDQIMEWLRYKLLETPGESITVPLQQFFTECSVDKAKFYTFYNEMQKTQIVKSFKIKIDGNNITFGDFKKNEDKE